MCLTGPVLSSMRKGFLFIVARAKSHSSYTLSVTLKTKQNKKPAKPATGKVMVCSS